MSKKNKKPFSSMTKEEQNEVISKVTFLIAYLDLSVEIVDELSEMPIFWKHKIKLTGKAFLTESTNYLNEILFLSEKEGTPLKNTEGKVIGETSEVQLQAWELIKKLKKINNEAVAEYATIVK